MSEKVTEKLIIGFEGKRIPDYIRRFVENYNIGGIILFNRNFSDIDDLANLTNAIKKMGVSIICIDQEGGLKSRIEEINIPSSWELGQLNNPQNIYWYFYKMAIELGRLNINLNLAPCCEIGFDGSYIKQRTFGTDPFYIALCVKKAVEGMTNAGIDCCIKHFIGLAKTSLDPHQKLPVSHFDETELLPFKAGIDGGAKYLMTTHIVIPEISNEILTYSTDVITYIRDKLNYEGLIVTDDLLMSALDDLPLIDRINRSIEAGYDRIILSIASEAILNIILDRRW